MKVTKALLKKLHANPKDVLETMTTQDIAKLLDAASDAYYNTANALMTDDMFDLVKDALQQRDPNNPALRRVGAPIRGEKVELPFWMGSMDKIRDDPKQLQKWKAKYDGQYIVSDKLDGNSAMIVYNKNGTIQMFSRGDGEFGQDISHLVPMINHVPPFNGVPASGLAVRGELIISRANWAKISDLGANARNVVAGTMNAKHPNSAITDKIDFVAYEMLKPKTLGPSACLDALDSMGFKVMHREIIAASTLSVDTLSDILVRRRRDSEYEIDGIIVEHDEIHKTVKGKNPAHAFAFKSILTHDEAEVVVKEVEWNVSKDGYMKPTVIFDAVQIAGVTIQRATGFNASFIEKNVIGPGARIVIIRSGDVIPYIVRVLSPASAKQPSMPTQPYVWGDTHVDILVASGNNSSDMMLKQMEHFVSSLDVKHVAAGTLKRLYEAGHDTIPKLLRLKEEDILKIDGFKTASAKRIVEGFQQAKTRASCTDMMVASNVFGRGLGKKKIELIVDALPKVMEGSTPTMEELLKIKGAGEETAKAFAAAVPAFFKFMDEIGVPCKPKPKAAKSTSSATLANQTFVFTGFRNKEWEEKVVALGGKVATSVSKSTSFVVAEDPTESTSKLNKARDLSVRIISKDAFAKMLLT